MNTYKKMFPYLSVCAIAFYVLPLFGSETGVFIVILLFFLPLTCLMTSIIYGVNNGLNLLVPLGIGLLFGPTIFIYYNSTAWIYIIGYATISLIGNFIGGTVKNT